MISLEFTEPVYISFMHDLTWGRCMNPPYLLAVGGSLEDSLLFFYKDGFGIK